MTVRVPGVSLLVVGLLAAVPVAAHASSLRGTHASMVHQNWVAHADHLAFVQTPADIAPMVAAGQLVQIEPAADLVLKGMSYPYARPAVRDFIERMASDYRAACGEPMVVTSAVRPVSLRLPGSSPLSVHPAGIAVDLHIPDTPACHVWLQNRLLWLESANVLDVTQERHPPHFHVAVFPEAWSAYAAHLPPLPSATAPAVEEYAVAPRQADLASSLLLASPSDPAGARLGLFVGVLVLATMAMAPALPLHARLGKRRRR